ncbi:Methyltransferase domain containing protein [uncultured Caudovirales phage]|uniref:Methyltransferase domain containing protein n=1 Tax=uncultured Caudovirales phage TaxID=2100421 RepID=A0A6J5RDY5_9CAUD|nr:Methyltransferase domain containing protein [uncultured Caudovirales phage]
MPCCREMLPMIGRHEAVTRSYMIPGMMWPQELCWLYDSFSPSRMHAEIGAFCGKSLYASSVGMQPGSRVIAVEPTVTAFDTPGAAWTRDVLDATISEIEKREVHVTLVAKLSIDACREFTGTEFDSVFIDGSHHYADVCCDIQCWKPLVRSGGIIAGHDYWPRDAGVMDAVNELVPGFQVVPGTRIWWATL